MLLWFVSIVSSSKQRVWYWAATSAEWIVGYRELSWINIGTRNGLNNKNTYVLVIKLGSIESWIEKTVAIVMQCHITSAEAAYVDVSSRYGVRYVSIECDIEKGSRQLEEWSNASQQRA